MATANGGVARVTHGHFEKFAQSRMEFVRSIAALAERPEYLESLLDEDAFGMLKPLLVDKVPTVQQTAALALGRIASYSVELSEELVKSGILEQLTASMRGSSTGHMKAGAFVIKAVAKHSDALCACCLEAGCASTLVTCMEHLDVTVREAAAQALGTLASHAGSQAAVTVEAGALPFLVAALAEPEPALKKAAAATLGEIAKHTAELAGAVVASAALPSLTHHTKHAEAKVRRQVCNTLSHIVKHSAALAEAAVDAHLFPAMLVCMQDSDSGTARNASVCVREVVKHNEQLASVVVECGGIGSLIEFLTTRPRGSATARGGGLGATAATATATSAGGGGMPQGTSSDRLAAIMALGFIAAYSETLSLRVLEAAGVGALKEALLEEREDHVRAAAVWALGQVGRHTPTHARALAEADVLRHIQAAMLDDDSSADLKDKSMRCLKAVLAQCDHVMAMQSLLTSSPAPITKAILRQLSSVLAKDVDQRKAFLASGGLKLVQTLEGTGVAPLPSHGAGAVGVSAQRAAAAAAAALDPEVVDLLEAINGVYPAEVVAYCRPDYMRSLAAKIKTEVAAETTAQRKAWLASQ